MKSIMTNIMKSLIYTWIRSSSFKSADIGFFNRNSFPVYVQRLEHSLQHTKAIKCWKCGIERQNINELFCQQCKIIQSPEDKNNYFKLLQNDEVFDIDFKILRDRYRHMQSVLHPDKFSNRSIEEKNISEDFSSLVNRAYAVLQSPLMRAVHLLNLKGEMIGEDEKIDDPEFLMEIMELNEEVENASTADELKALNISNKETTQKIEQDISKYFKENDLNKVKHCIIKLRYYHSISVHINNLMREKGIVD